jgi:FKBP-type peptidyl-prolyl cis-trans isomerase 2
VPQLIVIGKGNAIKGVEEAVRGMNVSETKKVELAPKDAFGEKDSSLVKVMPLSDFKKREIDPYPGMQLDIDGAVAIVKSVSSGRVIVDANHPLAGEKMVYEIRIIEKVDKDEDRIRALADTYGVSADSVAVSNGNARVLFGEKVEKDSKYLVNKSDFVNAVLRYMDKISKVTVEEDYVRKKAEEKGS